MKIQWHIPDSMRDGREGPLEQEETTWEALRDGERLKRWSSGKGFHRFSHAPYPERPWPVPFPTSLMAEYKHGKEFWVVCHMSEIPPDLPEWKHPGPR